MNYQFSGAAFVENIKVYANETVTARICEKLAGKDGEFGEIRTWQNNFAKWKKGESQPRAEDLIRIAEVCGCSVDDLLGISSPRKISTTTFDFLTIIDAAVQAGIADIEISEEGTAANMELVFPDDDDLLEYVKVCKVTTTNRRLVGLFDSYKQLTNMQKQNGLNNSICCAYFDDEKKKATPLGELSPDDTILTYKPIGGRSSLPFE